MENNQSRENDLEIILRAEKIRKVYPGTMALNGVNFNVYRGKVNVMVGENGAGKSTLMKILSGVEHPSSGIIHCNGMEFSHLTPKTAAQQGIGIIYQELNLFPNLSVAENIFLGREIESRPGWIDHKEQERRASEILNKLEQEIDPRSLVQSLKVGQQQIVEIAKALVEDVSILIMDEPTSALSKSEVDVLFQIIDELKNNGVSIIYISHRLEELIQIGDFITVLRDGNLITEKPMDEVNLQWIVSSMVGGDTSKIFHSGTRSIGDVLLKVEDFFLQGALEEPVLNHVSLELRQGEVLGIYGLLGAGRSEFLESIMGLHEFATGRITLVDELLGEPNIKDLIHKGIALVPEDRQREGLIQSMTVSHNLTLAGLWRIVQNKFHIGRKAEVENVSAMFANLSIKAPGPEVLITSLSGGNQQKVVFGKSLLTNPKVLLLDEPTRGIDVGAKGEIFNIMNDLAEKGLGIILVTSEIKELLAICDRVIVLSKGRITGEFSDKEMTEENLVNASAIGHITTSQRLKKEII
ncbi:sugar ABC transporter ATP-binding protein [Oceanispirochaeta sp.]|jgi:erythritol transport system ATP-binding protein|uniref:sugar ABC transporter ATP-binding protein n=1 Tax=Oceanispirochaeta sp. TaxID=2035350 RepID=UPI00261E497B|nr:sugar ABC transporter ATP-binding protein [Oceanispirochaeta sp.]MDA3958734.1 sugar ABC transporter ATP-binding protein [Oceanispirochaeta sp.]